MSIIAHIVPELSANLKVRGQSSSCCIELSSL